MQKNLGFQKIGDSIDKNRIYKKPPAYQWQDLALIIINELDVPNFKRSSVFKICRDHDKNFVTRCLIDTKELCKTGQKWKYFFKVISEQS